MPRMRHSRKIRQEAELDITAFMNLMIVLVPVLLLGMVFSQITVLDIKLPDGASTDSSEANDRKKVELLIREDGMYVNYPQGILLKTIPKVTPIVDGSEEQLLASGDTAPVHDFKLLSLVLQEIKRQLREKSIENRAITVLSEPNTSYQTVISAMDTVRSYKAVVAASVVEAELFPEVSFGDAPALAANNTGGGQ